MLVGFHQNIVAVQDENRYRWVKILPLQKLGVRLQQESSLKSGENPFRLQLLRSGLDIPFRKTVEGAGHFKIEQHHPPGEPLQQDFQRFLSGIAGERGIGKHFREGIPSPVPFAVILILVDQKGLLQTMEDGGDLLDQQGRWPPSSPGCSSGLPGGAAPKGSAAPG